MFEHDELFREKIEWNCKLEAMWADCHDEDDEDVEDDEG